MKQLLVLIALFVWSFPSLSQEKGRSESASRVTIRIVEEKDGKMQVERHSYDLEGLNSEQRQARIDSVLQKLDGNNPNRRVTITMEEGSFNRADRAPEKHQWDMENFRNWDFNSDRLSVAELEKLTRKLDTTLSKEAKKIEMKMNKFRADMESRPFEFPGEIAGNLARIRDFNWEGGFSSGSSTVRSVNIQPNQPFDGQLNIRFLSREKGNVVITVTDTQGKEQVRKVVRDFEGEYVGQVKLKVNASGVYFVTIVQNEDGVTQRVVVPDQKK